MEPETLEEIDKALSEILMEIKTLAEKSLNIKAKYLRKRENFMYLYSKAQKIDPNIPDLPRLPE